jgi:hypothetical protein
VAAGTRAESANRCVLRRTRICDRSHRFGARRFQQELRLYLCLKALSGVQAGGNMDELITAMCLGETVTASLMLARLITFVARKSLDSRVRGNDVLIRPGYLSELSNQPSIPRHSQPVIPANAGIQGLSCERVRSRKRSRFNLSLVALPA